MKKWIRWWGIVAFIVIVFGGILIWYLMADKIIANQIEDTGEYIFGAKVDVGNADMNLNPFCVTVTNLKVANPASPMKNLFDAEKVFVDIELDRYLTEKLLLKTW